MKALILEDDVKINNLIKSLLQKYYPKSITSIDSATNVKEAVGLINENNYDLFLFDVQLGKETSFEIFEIIEKTKAKIIFITANEKFAMNAIKVNAFDFLLKPIEIQEFKNSIDKVIDAILNNKKSISANNFGIKQENSLVLKSLDSINIVKLNEIIYLEADGPYTYVHLDKGEAITVSKHMKDFENRLNETGFYRIHNSFMINTLKMQSISKKNGLTVIMKNGKSIVISSRKKDDFFTFIEDFLEI